MPNVITAGNSSNGGTAITTDTSGTLNIVTGSGSGSNAITIDASQAVTMPGNLTVSGTLTASNGVSGSIRSGTAVASTSGTSIDFTSLPTGLKRITVMFNGVSTNGTSIVLIQLGSGSVTATGYLGASSSFGAAVSTSNFTTGFGIGATGNTAASTTRQGSVIISLVTSNTWSCFGSVADSGNAALTTTAGNIALGGVLDRVRITTVNGTDTFDAGTINILWE